MIDRWQRALIAAVLMLVAGCTIIDGRPGFSYMNVRNPGDSWVTATHPVPRATGSWTASKPTFVGVALSGGGSRSANFGMAVLEELDAIGLLEHVDAISSVSGGSIPAAWFAVYGREADWAARGREVVGRDLVVPLLGRLLRPSNLLASTFTDWDRTDVLASLYESRLFAGRRVTFGDLGDLGPRAPAVYFNATDTTAGGVRFVFRDADFAARLGSDLSQYPLAWAAAASGAFPGFFNSVTLRRFDPTQRGGEPQAGGAADPAVPPSAGPSQYLHLIDGGSSDNLGLQTLIEVARQHRVSRLNQGAEWAGCLLVLVDAHVPGAALAESRQSDRRNLASMLLDLNFLDAIDAMLTNRREQTLSQAGIRKDFWLGRFDLEWAPGLWEYQIRPYRRWGRMDIEFHEYGGVADADFAIDLPRNQTDFAGVRLPDRRRFECKTWHVALEDIQSIVPWQEHEGQMRSLDPTSERAADREVFAYRVGLSRVLAQLSTNYRLSGPPNCGEGMLQRALYDAARITVRQDHATLSDLCPWMVGLGLVRPGACKAEAVPLSRSDLAIEPILPPRSASRSEQATNRFVRCTMPEQPGHPQ